VNIGVTKLQLPPQGSSFLTGANAIRGDGGNGNCGEGGAGLHREKEVSFYIPAGLTLDCHGGDPYGATTMTTGAGLSLLTGTIGAVALALNHLTAGSSPANVSLGRADVVGSLMAVGLMLVGLNWTRVDPTSQEPLVLRGEQGLKLAEPLPESIREELGWGSQMVLLNTAAVAIHCIWNQRPLLCRGLLTGNSYEEGPLARRVLSRQQRLHLVNLKLFPGRQEFTYLPEDTPAVLLEPLGSQGLVVVAGASPRCFNAGDLGWVEGWAQRLGLRLEEAVLEGKLIGSMGEHTSGKPL